MNTNKGDKAGPGALDISFFPSSLSRPYLGPTLGLSARPVLLSDNVKMLNHTTTATSVAASLPASFCEGSLVSLCAVILSSRTHQYAMQELHQLVYFSSNVRQGDVWGLTNAMLMCMLMSLKYQTSVFLSVSCLFHLFSK